MKTRWWLVIALFVIIAVLLVILVAVPAHAPTISTTSTSSGQASAPSTATSTAAQEPLHASVVVTSPKAGATVGKSFTVTGEAPGKWYFEAVFPIFVRDSSGDKIGATQAQAQSDWTTTAQVPFTATVTLDTPYSGPATLVLLRDNPSGLPENDDSLEVPIVIQ